MWPFVPSTVPLTGLALVLRLRCEGARLGIGEGRGHLQDHAVEQVGEGRAIFWHGSRA